MGMHPEAEKALQDRDERVAKWLADTLRAKQVHIEALEHERRELEKDVRAINNAVDAAKWSALRGVLMDEDIESLCDISPTSESMRHLMREFGE